MASVNKVILIGNLGANPELRATKSGTAVCEVRLATNDAWTDKSGQKQERTEWHRVVIWGRSAENVAKYMTKGRSLYVEGHLQTREWTDKEGVKRYTTEIVAERIQFLGSKPEGVPSKGDYPPPPNDDDAPSGDSSFSDDDLPF